MSSSLEPDLRLALQAPVTQLVLHYQPVLDLSTGRVVGVESLVRWQHPVLGLLGPGQFIGLAEETGLIHRLGDWALERAATDVAGLTHDGRALELSVNLSAVQLDADVAAKVQHALEVSGLAPELLTVEVTESAFVRDEGLTAETYDALSRLGVKFAVDDCGTSFSSLLRLRRFPVSALKIDAEFVAGIGIRANDEAMCDSVMGRAASVAAATVAEGVETPEQYGVLRAMGCRRGQGWLWSRAVPLDELPAAMAASEQVPVAERGSRLPRVPGMLSDDLTTAIARMHAEGVSHEEIAAVLNRTVGRHPSGVRWTAGAVARGLPTTSPSTGQA